MRGGYSGGYSSWIFIFEKLDIQNSCQAPPLWGYSNNPKKGGLIQETGTLRTTFESRFLAYPPIYTRVEAIGGGVGTFREGGAPHWEYALRYKGGYFVLFPPLITWKSSIRRSQRVKSGHWRQAFLFQ